MKSEQQQQIEMMKVSRAKRRIIMSESTRMAQILLATLIFQLIISILTSAQLHNSNNNKRQKQDNVVAEMQVLCHSDAIVLKVSTNTPFNGMLYTKDATSSNDCVSEFHSSTNMTFRLPLKSCGTLFAEVDDGIEYFNTVIVQPHMRLMTNQGKGYHIRCKYQTRERTIANTHFNVSAGLLMQNGPQASTTPLLATASMPSCTMKIFRSGRDDVAETVKIGDKLIMVIEIDQQDMYGMKIANCVVRDGMNLAEQQLINEQGCPLDETIMPKFEYTNNYTRASVSFPAHKFLHTSSVYYQCNVRLCINNGNCEQADCLSPSAATTGPSPANSLLGPAAGSATGGGPRRKRFAGHHNQAKGSASSLEPPNVQLSGAMSPAPSELSSKAANSKQGGLDAVDQQQQVSFDVYSGLYVSDVDVGESGSSEPNGQQIGTLPNGDLSSSSSSQQSTSTPFNCLKWARAGLLVVIASCVAVGLVLLLALQVGLVGGGGGSSGRGAEFIPWHSANLHARSTVSAAPSCHLTANSRQAAASLSQAYLQQQARRTAGKQLYGMAI